MENKQAISIIGILNGLIRTFFLLLKQWKLVLFFCLIGGGFGIYKSIKSEPIFEGKLTFIVDEEAGGGSGGGLASLMSTFGGGSDQASLFSNENLIEFLKSRNLLEKTLLKEVNHPRYKGQTFASLYLKSYKLDSEWSKNKQLKNISFSVKNHEKINSITKDSILGNLCSMISESNLLIVKPQLEASLIEVKLNSPNEIFSKLFIENLMDVASKYYVYSKTKKNQQNVDILQKQVDSVRRQLDQSITGIAVNNDDVFGLSPAYSVKRVPSAKKQVDIQANTVILSELVKNLEITKMSLLKETPLVEIIDYPKFPLNFKKISKFKGLVIGGFVGFILGTIFVLLFDFYKTNKQKLNFKR